jgi:hypothetical protein
MLKARGALSKTFLACHLFNRSNRGCVLKLGQDDCIADGQACFNILPFCRETAYDGDIKSRDRLC